MAKAKQLDFTKVKDGGNFNKKHKPEGDYPAKITKVEDVKSKADDVPMWLFTIQVGSGSYPYYCKLQENQLWKIRNLFVAAGINVPKKRVQVDPNKVIGREIAVTLEDEEYEGRMQSSVSSTFPLSELDPSSTPDADDSGDDDEEPDEAPKAKKDKKSKKAEPAKGKKGKAKASDADLEELDIEDI